MDSYAKEEQWGKKEDENDLSTPFRIFMTRVQKLAKANLLDSTLLSDDVRLGLEYLKEKRIDLLQNKLNDIAEILKERSIISSALDLPDKDSFETTSHTFRNYAQLISKFRRYSHNSQHEIIQDLTRDLSALKMYVDRSSAKGSKPANIKREFANSLHSTLKWQYLTTYQKYAKLEEPKYTKEKSANQLGQYVITKWHVE